MTDFEKLCHRVVREQEAEQDQYNDIDLTWEGEGDIDLNDPDPAPSDCWPLHTFGDPMGWGDPDYPRSEIPLPTALDYTHRIFSMEG